jgi:hypothetical protein
VWGRTTARAALAALLAATFVAAGCGVGAGDSPSGARLTVTEGFGTRQLTTLEAPKVSGSDTVMRLLQRNAKVTTRYGGGFVQSIDGRSGGTAGGRPVDWFFYVNGVESHKGAASVKLRDDDRIWWDRHDWGATNRIPAVVGSFPEPLRHGIDGKRLPVRLECVEPRSQACRAAGDRLAAVGVIAGRGGLQGAITKETLRVLVGPWDKLRADTTARLLERGPATSGVFARITPDGRSIRVLDPGGGTTRTLGAGAGLVAATRLRDDQPVWIVTGTDDRGVVDAAGALEEGALSDKFALAIDDGRAVALPEVAR